MQKKKNCQKIAIFLKIAKIRRRDFPEGQDGRDGPFPWSARITDVTPLDFFFMGYVEDRVFRNMRNIH